MWENGARTREEEREMIQEVRQTGLNHPLYMLLDRVDPYPVHFLLILAVWSDPDGSGSIQRSWSVSLIRIHQVHGSGPLTVGLGLVFCFLEFLVLIVPIILLSEPLCALIFFTKTQKNYSMFLKLFFIVLWCCYMLRLIKKYICIYFTCSCIFAYSFDEFLA